MSRICFTTCEWPPHPGGVARSAHRIVSALTEAGHEVTVFKPEFGTGQEVSLERYHHFGSERARGAYVYSMAAGPDKWAEAIEWADKRTRFDLFHGFFLPHAYPSLEVARKGNRPVVASIRGVDGVQFHDPFSRAVLQQASWITSVSSASLKRVTRFADITGRCSVILNSIQRSPAPSWTLSSTNLGVVGTVSTFRRKKNLPLLAESYARISPSVRRRLLLVGDFLEGKDLNVPASLEFKALTERLGVASEVEITGYVERRHVLRYLPRMRVFALSSDHEGLPNAILEAADAGVPLVATEVDGVVDVFNPDDEAILVPPGDSAALASALERVLADDNLARRLSNGARLATERLTPERETSCYVALYSQLLR